MLILSEVTSILGLKEFKKRQVEAIMSILNENDTFVSLLTGYGNLVIYTALPFVEDHSNLTLDRTWSLSNFVKLL